VKVSPTVFVISLPGSSCRAALVSRVAALGVEFRLVEAINGRLLSPDKVAEVYDARAARRRLGREMSAGEIGCALSHRQVYRTMLAEGLETAVVLEDDAIVDDEFVEILRQVQRVPDKVELLLFRSVFGFVWRKPEFSMGSYTLHAAASPLVSAVAYFVRSSAARKILQTPRIDSVADWPLCHRSIGQYLALPMPVSYSSDTSTLASERYALQRQQERSLLIRVARAAAHLLFVPYFLAPWRYAGLQNYIDREVGWRVLRHLPRYFAEAATAEKIMQPQAHGMR
jgi:glycosyl transferase family 25